MKLPVIILGAGGHAKVLIDALQLNGRTILGMATKEAGLTGQTILGVPIIGDDESILSYSPQKVALVNGVGSIRSSQAREALWHKFKERGYHFVSVVHPAATVANDVQIDEGAQIMAGAIVQTGCDIGANVIINTKASLDHDCRLGSHVHIAPGATLSGGVHVGDNVHIGTGAVIIQGISVGQGSLVAAGAVIVNDIPAGAIVRGIPGKVVKL